MKKLLLTIFTFIIAFRTLPVYAEPFNFDAEAYILIDSKSGCILYDHNSNKILFPASTTKIMTAILALENAEHDRLMTASKKAVYDIGKDGMNIGIMPGEEIRLENLLEAMLISSANETANIIAENICETRQEFVDLMNKRAKELGALNTNFTNPCGAHDDNHYTTAADLSKIAAHAMKIENFRDIVCKKSYQITPTNKHTEWPELYSTNLLLRQKKSELFEINGIKTGYTGQAGQNLVSSAIDEKGMELIAIVLGVKNPDKGKKNTYQYCYDLLQYGFENFSVDRLVDSGKLIKTVQVSDAGENSKLELRTADSLEYVAPIDITKKSIIRSIEHINPEIKAPIEKGDILGYVEYEANGIILGKIDLIASQSINKIEEEILKTPNKSSPLVKVLKYTFFVLLGFSMLRFVLRKLSRKLNSAR